MCHAPHLNHQAPYVADSVPERAACPVGNVARGRAWTACLAFFERLATYWHQWRGVPPKMKEVTIADTVKRALEQEGTCLHTWILAQLQAHGFDLQRPVHYRYHPGLQLTRIYQYEYGPNDGQTQQDFDADFLDTEAWDRACELLLQDTARYHEAEVGRHGK